jgi:serine/threonine-protein kinase
MVALNAALAGRYTITRELGEGGMATVYLAQDIKHDRSVALKVLKPELAEVIGAERFLVEIKTTAALQHPHILPLFDSGEADGFLFYVMPYVEGETLGDRIGREKQLPVDEAVEITRAVAQALQHAHDRGVIHRDIKPGNILLQDGQPVVSDFGIALALGVAGGNRLTETGLSLGTPHYMSPEQATGDRTVDARSDLFSLACVTYEMLVGEPPHTASNAQAVMAKLITQEPTPIT